MKTIHVSTGSPYDIMIERGILDNCGEIIKKLSNAEKITIVTDTNVAPLYKWRVLNSLSQQGYQTTAHVFQAGEQSKNLNTIADIYDTLADFKMTRKDLIFRHRG